MIGNVWDWTTTTYQTRHVVTSPCCGPSHGCVSRRSDDPQDVEGWLTSVRAGLLPAIPPCGAIAAVAGHLNDPHRLSVRGEPLSVRDHAAGEFLLHRFRWQQGLWPARNLNDQQRNQVLRA
jgi:hypothetical protein